MHPARHLLLKDKTCTYIKAEYREKEIDIRIPFVDDASLETPCFAGAPAAPGMEDHYIAAHMES